jgi:hypothetical protein
MLPILVSIALLLSVALYKPYSYKLFFITAAFCDSFLGLKYLLSENIYGNSITPWIARFSRFRIEYVSFIIICLATLAVVLFSCTQASRQVSYTLLKRFAKLTKFQNASSSPRRKTLLFVFLWLIPLTALILLRGSGNIHTIFTNTARARTLGIDADGGLFSILLSHWCLGISGLFFVEALESFDWRVIIAKFRAFKVTNELILRLIYFLICLLSLTISISLRGGRGSFFFPVTMIGFYLFLRTGRVTSLAFVSASKIITGFIALSIFTTFFICQRSLDSASSYSKCFVAIQDTLPETVQGSIDFKSRYANALFSNAYPYLAPIIENHNINYLTGFDAGGLTEILYPVEVHSTLFKTNSLSERTRDQPIPIYTAMFLSGGLFGFLLGLFLASLCLNSISLLPRFLFIQNSSTTSPFVIYIIFVLEPILNASSMVTFIAIPTVYLSAIYTYRSLSTTRF